MKFRVALPQIRPKLGDKTQNIERIEAVLKTTRAELIIFPELFLTGYMCRDKFPALAESLEDRSVRKVAQLAAKNSTTIVFGMPELKKNMVYNSAVLVEPNGHVTSYHKIYLANFGPFEERQYFASGNNLTLITTELGKIGLLVCYDIFFPELAKLYALQGTDIIICISASPSSTISFFEKVLPARAIENTVFVLYSNLVGTELGLIFAGGSRAFDPRGEPLCQNDYYREKTVLCELNTETLRVARRFRPTLRDTKPEFLQHAIRLVGSQS